MSAERIVVCHDPDGKPCGRLTEQECHALSSAGKGRAVRSRKGALVRFILTGWPEPLGWKGSSRTQTQRIRNDRGEIVAPSFHLEFKPLVYSRPQG
jgi:hypothetical protein